MLNVIKVEQNIENTTLVKDIYNVEAILKDIQNKLEKCNELEETDYIFINLTFEKLQAYLAKVNTLLNMNILLKLNAGGEARDGQTN